MTERQSKIQSDVYKISGRAWAIQKGAPTGPFMRGAQLIVGATNAGRLSGERESESLFQIGRS
jgi:hypothetical protein